jgi:hypothetical protein
MRFVLPRVLGAVTAGYGVAIFARPELLLKQAGLLRGDTATAEQATFVRTLAARDLGSGLAMMTATSRSAMRAAIGVRVLSDAGDLVVLGRALAGRPERTKNVAAAAGWGLLCAASALTTRCRRGPSGRAGTHRLADASIWTG